MVYGFEARLIILFQARDNKLTIEDMAGGTFTISNVSVVGSEPSDGLLTTIPRVVYSAP